MARKFRQGHSLRAGVEGWPPDYTEPGEDLGGNQRELARQKNVKTQDLNKGKPKDDSLSAAQRKQRDSEMMQLKQKAADQKKSMQVGSK